MALWEESPVTLRKVQVKTLGELLEVRAVVQNRGPLKGTCEVVIKSEVLAAGDALMLNRVRAPFLKGVGKCARRTPGSRF